jgi:hypothetical protein
MGILLALAVTTLGVDPSAAAGRTYVSSFKPNPDVLPADSKAGGKATFVLSADGKRLHYELVVEDMETVNGAHVHMTPGGLEAEGLRFRTFRRVEKKSESHGPAVVLLMNFHPKGLPGYGVVADGEITGADLVGPLKGQPLSTLMNMMDKGHLYVNIHTLQRFGGGQKFCCPEGLYGKISLGGALC